VFSRGDVGSVDERIEADEGYDNRKGGFLKYAWVTFH